MGYTDLLNRPNVYISYNGNDTGVVDNTGNGSLGLVRSSGAPVTFATDNPYSEFGSCLVTQNQYQESWYQSGQPGDIYGNSNERWREGQVLNSRGWEFWIKIDSSVNLTTDSILLEWTDGTDISRIVLGTDRRISMTGPFIYTTYMGIGVPNTVYSDVLSLDEWHLVSVTAKLVSTPPGTYSYSFSNKANSHMFVDGKIYRHTNTTNDASIKGFVMPTHLFSQVSVPGIKIAHFAFWNDSIIHKHHVRRYMYGKAKTSQETLIINSNPWASAFMNDYATVGGYGIGGTYVNPGDPQSVIGPTTETVINGAADFNYHGGVEGTPCIKMTKSQSDPTLITNAGNFGINQVAAPYNFHKLWQDNALNTGNYSIEFWYKNGFSQRDYDSTANGLSPIMIMIVGGSVVHNLRLTTSGEFETVVKLNNAASSASLGAGNQWSMIDTGKRIDNEWHHFAIVSTYNNPVLNVKTYVDGALYNEYNNANVQVLNSSYQVNPSDPNQYTIGFFYGAAQQYQTGGHLDNLAFYTRQLTEAEVRSRYLNYNIVEKPHIKGVKQRKYYSSGSGTSGSGYSESIRNILQPADNVLYNNGSTFIRNPNQIKYYDGTQWVTI
jgi:hypothetical protein